MTRPRRRQRSHLGNVQQLPSKRWRARFTAPDGTRKTLGTFDTEREAWAAVHARAHQTNTGQWTPTAASQATLLTVWRDYVQHTPTTSGGVDRKRTQFERRVLTGESLTRADKAAIKKAREAAEAAGREYDPSTFKVSRTLLGGYPIVDISLPVARAWVREMVAEGLSATTIDSHWDLLTFVLKYAVKERFIGENPLEGETPPVPTAKRRADERNPFFLTLAEMVQMTQAASPDHALYIETLLWTGGRESEIRALREDDVDLPTGSLWVNEAATTAHGNRNIVRMKETKTTDSERPIPVPPPILSALSKRVTAEQKDATAFINALGDLNTGDPLFPSAKDPSKHLDDRRAWDAWDYARSRVGGELLGDPSHRTKGRRHAVRPHDARATVTSLLFAIGASVPEVMVFVGHGDSKSTLEIYSAVQRWTDLDPVIEEVKALRMPLAAKWARLYERAWEEYGDVAFREDDSTVIHGAFGVA